MVAGVAVVFQCVLYAAQGFGGIIRVAQMRGQHLQGFAEGGAGVEAVKEGGGGVFCHGLSALRFAPRLSVCFWGIKKRLS